MSYIYPEKELVGYLLLKRIFVQDANTISSPITYGFPFVGAFTGLVHALSRKISQPNDLQDISLDGVLIACHECIPKIYRENPYKDYTFIQTRNPILKSGKTAPIIEEGKCNLVVSLMIGVYADDYLSKSQIASLKDNVKNLIYQQRMAGGSILSLDKFNPVDFFEREEINNHKNKLLPAFVLIDARKELDDITRELQQSDPNATALDALIETATFHYIPDDNGEWHVKNVKQGRGWLVPIPVGYQGISPVFDAGQMQHSRNPEYPSQYVESIYGLGKWVFPHSICDLEECFWYQTYDAKQDLYLVKHLNEL